METGVTFPTHACGVRPIAMHCANWPIRADCACRKEFFFLENDVLARVGAYRDYNNVKYVKNVFFEH